LTIAIVALGLTTLAVTFLAADAASHSASDTLYAWVVPAGLVTLVGSAALLFVRQVGRR
jgi:hypothetical protein